MSQIEILCGPTTDQIVRAVTPVQESCFQAPNWTPKGAWFIDNVKAQYDVVSRRYNGSPDTIELIAVMPNKNPNGLAYYTASFQNGVSQSVNGVFAILPSMTAELVDEQSRIYTWNQVNSTILQDGAYKKVIERNGTLRRSDGLNLLGVTIITTQYVNNLIFDLDIDIRNDLVEQIIGNIFFKSIHMSLGVDYKLMPKTGSLRPCSSTLSDKHYIAKNGNYYIPKQGSFHRRYIGAPRNYSPNTFINYRQKFGGLGFCLGWSDSFGVVKTGIGTPTNDYRFYGWDGLSYKGREAFRKKAQQRLSGLQICLQTGSPNTNLSVYFGAYGPFHPFYLQAQGAQGGFGINHYTGYELCLEDYASQACVHAMNSERQAWNARFANGKPKTAENYLQEGNGQIKFDFAPFDFGINGLPAFNNAGDFNTGSANRGISTFAPHDAPHQCRYTKPLQTLVYLGNDWLGKKHLEMTAEIDYLYWNPYPQVQGWAHGMNLFHALNRARNNPHQGWLLSRGRCWAIDGVMSYFHVAPPQWRNKLQPWLPAMAECIAISQMPTGWNNRHAATSNDQVIATGNLGPQWDAAQAFEIEYEDWAKRCLLVAMTPGSRHRNILNESIIRSAKSFFTSNIYNGHAYRWFIAVARSGGQPLIPEELSFQLTSGNEEVTAGWQVLNHAYLASQELNRHDINWLDKSLTYRLSVGNYQAKITQLSKLASEYWNDHMPAAIGLMHSLSTAS